MNDEEKIDLWEHFNRWVEEYPSDCTQVEIVGNILECCIGFLVTGSCCASTGTKRAANINWCLSLALMELSNRSEEK